MKIDDSFQANHFFFAAINQLAFNILLLLILIKVAAET